MKKIIAMALALVLVAGLSISGTMAWLQDEDSAANVMTLGNVKIEQIEQERDASGNLVDFKQAKPAYPAVGPIEWADTTINVNGGNYKVFTPDLKNVVDKIVTVNNTGKSDAFVRTIIAFETPDYDPNGWLHININDVGITMSNWITTEINGVEYCIASFTYTDKLAAGASSAPSLLQVFLDSKTNNDYCDACGNTMDILVLSQAVQTAGFENAQTALDTAFGKVTAANVAEWFKDIDIPTVASNAQELQDAVNNGGNIILGGDIDLSNGGIVIP